MTSLPLLLPRATISRSVIRNGLYKKHWRRYQHAATHVDVGLSSITASVATTASAAASRREAQTGSMIYQTNSTASADQSFCINRRTMTRAFSTSANKDDVGFSENGTTADNRYIITKDEINSMDGTSKVHFLNDNAKRTNKSLGDLTGLQNIGFHIIEVQPGYESTELHKHYNEEECIYILQGEAIATIGYNDDNDEEDEGDDNSSNEEPAATTFHVKAGDFIGYRANGLPHSLWNCSQTTTLKCIVVGQRLDNDVADYPALNLRLYRNKQLPDDDKWNLVDIDSITKPLTTAAGDGGGVGTNNSNIGKK